MKVKHRSIFKLLVFLLAGATINVAVAWGFALHDCVRFWSVLGTLRTLRSTDVPAISNKRDLTISTPLRPIRIDMRFPTKAGWPCPSHEAVRFEERGGKFEKTNGLWSAGIQLHPQRIGLTGGGTIVLPVRPIYSGFAINAIFYASIVWTLFAAPFKLRRWHRIKRGHCAACGYSLRGTPDTEKCPECGVAVKKDIQ